MAEEDVRQTTNAMLDIISLLVHESEPVNDQGAGMDSLQYAMVIFFCSNVLYYFSECSRYAYFAIIN